MVHDLQLDRLGRHLLARSLGACAEGDEDVRAQPERDRVPLVRRGVTQRWPLQRHGHLRRRDRQTLAGPDEERDAVPAPGVDVQTDGGEGLDVRIGRDPRLAPVAGELSADEVLPIERPHAPEGLHLLVADRLVIGREGRLHGEETHDLEQVVLHDVPDRARLVVEFPPTLDAEGLRHRDLHAVDVVAVPDRLEEGVGEAEHCEVLDGPLAEVMVDAEDVRLVERRVERGVERARRLEIPPEGLLDDDARIARAARSREPFDDGREHARRDREVVRRSVRLAERRAKRRIGRGIAVVAVHVAQP